MFLEGESPDTSGTRTHTPMELEFESSASTNSAIRARRTANLDISFRNPRATSHGRWFPPPPRSFALQNHDPPRRGTILHNSLDQAQTEAPTPGLGAEFRRSKTQLPLHPPRHPLARVLKHPTGPTPPPRHNLPTSIRTRVVSHTPLDNVPATLPWRPRHSWSDSPAPSQTRLH